MIVLGAGCGDDDEDAAERTVTETIPATETVAEETEADPTDDTATGEVPTGSEAQSEREIVDTLRAFNRTANLGKLQQACQDHFSEAFLTRLPTERECATTLAGARGGEKKVQMEVGPLGPIIDHAEGRASVTVALGGRFGDEGTREIELVFENGAWKIDAVTTP